jgi:hypothetical protein
MRLNWKNWRAALVLLSLLATGAVQLAAATHWHPMGGSPAVAGASQQTPAGDSGDRCLLCQVATHLSSAAPPPSPWVLLAAPRTSAGFSDVAQRGVAIPLRSYAWQGRAPPRI